MTTLFVSPHFDDVVLSCVAHVREARTHGPVVVATAFGAGQTGRAAEDAEAMALLGARQVVLPFLDAPERLHIGASFGSLLLSEYHQEARDVETLTSALRTLAASLGAATIFLPLGVGWHVDHRVVHACHATLGRDAEIRFYEERPYADVPGCVEARLRDAGASAAAASCGPAPARGDVCRGVEATLGSFLPPEPGRRDAVDAFCARVFGAAVVPTGLQLIARTVPADPDAATAIACYRSQASWMFEGPGKLREFVEARPYERVWRKVG